jgi:hypothetical protein
VAFISHLEHNPQEFKYCPTPDCSQIYRCTNSVSSVVHCPSCFLAVCSSCHEEAHGELNCADNKLHNDVAAQEYLNEQWATQQGVKKCPSCNIWIEKLEGCNHVACRCGAHICWKCMGTFTQDEIYRHMGTSHGGFYDNDIAVAQYGGADQEYLWQARALRDYHAQQEAHRREERLREELEAERRRQMALRECRRQQAARRAEERLREIRVTGLGHSQQASTLRREGQLTAALYHKQEQVPVQTRQWGCIIA